VEKQTIGRAVKGHAAEGQFVSAVLHNPDLLILDEPFSGLDPVNVKLLKEIVLDLRPQVNTIIFSTHQMELAEEICDDICLLNRSRKVLEGSIREVSEPLGEMRLRCGFEGGDGVLDDRTLVSAVKRYSDGVEVLLAEKSKCSRVVAEAGKRPGQSSAGLR